MGTTKSKNIPSPQKEKAQQYPLFLLSSSLYNVTSSVVAATIVIS